MVYFVFKGGSSGTGTYTQTYKQNPANRNLATNLPIRDRNKTPDFDKIAPDTKEDFETPVPKAEYTKMLRDVQATASPETAQVIEKEIKSLKDSSNTGLKK